jgi:hypothetical protein
MAATIRTRSGLERAVRALAAERLFRSEQRIPHLRPIENRIGRIFQSCNAATKVFDVVEVVLDCLADDVSPATAELSRCSIELGPKLVRQSCGDLNDRTPDEVSEKSMTSA